MQKAAKKISGENEVVVARAETQEEEHNVTNCEANGHRGERNLSVLVMEMNGERRSLEYRGAVLHL